MSEARRTEKKEGKIQEITAKANLTWQHDLAFLVNFDIPTIAPLKTDEPPESGGSGEGANASRLLAAAIGNCLSASYAFCIRRSKLELKSLKTDIEVKITRNEKGYLRVKEMKVNISPEFKSEEDVKKAERCRQVFQDYCMVTEAVRKGIPVEVNVR